jgi:hypothetical protein
LDNRGRAVPILRATAVVNAVAAVILLLGTWDALYSALDLPHAGPALLAQLGGAALLGLGYLQWVAPRDVEMKRAVALASLVTNGLGALVIALWLIFRGASHLDIGTRGVIELLVFALILAGLAGAQARILTGRRSRCS